MLPAGISCIRRPRAATSLRASARVITSARQSAAYSPMLWPIIATGRTPQLIHRRASAYSMTNSAGWTIQRRLDDPGLLQRCRTGLGIWPDQAAQILAKLGEQDFGAAVDFRAEQRLGVV